MSVATRSHANAIPPLGGVLGPGRLIAWLQPQVALATGAVVGYEALVRWVDVHGHVSGPGQFLQAVLDQGHGTEVFRTVLEQACEALAMLSEPGEDTRVSVNIDGQTLQEPWLADHLRAVLSATGLSPDRLCLEITEQVVASDAASALPTLRRLKARGVRLAIDDFGTGHSSLAQLHSLPVDELKLDRAFITPLGRTPSAGEIVRTVTTLADQLGLEVIAEGVETPTQAVQARSLGCQLGQGFLWHPPAPPDVVGALTFQPVATAAPVKPERVETPRPPDLALLSVLGAELASPLMLARLTADGLADQQPDDPLVTSLLHHLDDIESVMGAVADLEAFALGQLRIAPTATDLVPLAMGVVRELELPVALSMPSVAVARVDVVRVRRVLRALLTDAHQRGAGGRLSLSLEVDEDALRITVARDGDPVSAREERGLFADDSWRHDGAGLFIPLARAVARAHGGEVRIENHEDGGAAYLLSLPRGADG